MNDQTVTKGNPVKKLSFSNSFIERISNDGKITKEHLANPFDIKVTRDSKSYLHFNFKVYIEPGAYPLNFTVDETNTKYHLEYNYPEGNPDDVDVYEVSAKYKCDSLNIGDQVTLYNRDIDPITSSGKKATVQPST